MGDNDNRRTLLGQRASRRTLLRGTLGMSLAGLLAACGSDDEDEEASPTSTAEATASEQTATKAGGDATAIMESTEPTVTPAETEESDEEPTSTGEAEESPTSAGSGNEAYPVTIDHKYGSTTIEQTPERIVLVGLVEQDSLLALGIVPVATTEWYGGRPGAIFPWAEDLLDGAEPPVVLDSTEMDFEQIISLEPDIIIGLYAGITQEQYDTLSQIAPTVAQPEEYVDWGIPWQELTATIGDIVGQRAAADALVADVEAAFEAAREEHPEFEGLNAVIASPWGLPENYYVYASQDVRGRLLESLGFDVPEVFDELAGEEFGATVSIEQLDLIADLDALIWISSPDALADVELYQALPVVQEGRVLYYGEERSIYDALNFSTVLSLPYAIENLLPDLVVTIDGDPDTQPEG